MARHWPRLESLTFARCDVNITQPRSHPPSGLFADFKHLKKLAILGGIGDGVVGCTVINLPSTVTSLSLGAIGMYSLDDDRPFARPGARPLPSQAKDFFPHLAKQGAQFTQFYALDPLEACSSDRKGLYNNFILSLTNVQHLTISPYAVSNLTNVLGQLAHLRHLGLGLRDFDSYAYETDHEPPEGAEFPVKEVIKMLNKVKQLERVEVWSDGRAGWSVEEQGIARLVTRG
jgi:hypothetical protein